jgi:predicted transcriptional regulator of viral defense system
MKLIEMQEKLHESGLKIFTGLEFRMLTGYSKVAAQKLLERYSEKGVFVRIKPGLFCLKKNMPSQYFIANRIYKPSYISFETALSFYGMIPETVYGCTSATTMTTRRFNAAGQNYSYHKIKKNAFTGYIILKTGEEEVLFAEKEKALADYFYYVFLKKRKMNDRLRIKDLNKNAVMRYAEMFGKPKFREWIKNVIF